jgi:hypothetical protein
MDDDVIKSLRSIRATFMTTQPTDVGGDPSKIALGPLAHPEEQETFNLKVPGSRPGRPTTAPVPIAG